MKRPLLAMTLLCAAAAAAPLRLVAQEAPSTDGPLTGGGSAPAASGAAPIVRRNAKWDTPPRVVKTVDPEFSEQARRERFSGTVTMHVFLDERGNLTDVQVARGIGHGLDEQAIKAVRQYVFQPAMKNGVPVACELYVGVNFQIFSGPH